MPTFRARLLSHSVTDGDPCSNSITHQKRVRTSKKETDRLVL